MKEMFNIKVDGETHRKLKIVAAYANTTIQEVVRQTIATFYDKMDMPDKVSVEELIKNKSRE